MPLLPGESAGITIEATGDAAGEPFVGVATTTTTERVVSNNTAQAATGIAGGVSVSVAVDRSPLFVGGVSATATYTVRNVGTLPTLDVRLTTVYPAAAVPSGAAPARRARGCASSAPWRVARPGS